MARHVAQGFTLVELIAVIVVLSISVTIGAGFIVDVVDQYQKSSLRSSIVMRGAVTMEQMGRKLRQSVPNSVRVSSSGLCVEFLPLVGGSVYTEPVADSENGRNAADTIQIVGLDIISGDAIYALVSPMSSAEVYSGAGAASVRAEILSLVGSPTTAIQLASAHRFVRNSVSNRVLVADRPERFCVLGGQLVNYRDYLFATGVPTDGNPGGNTVVMADGVTATAAFALTAGSENRNAALDMAINFSGGSETVLLNSRVLIRNVP